MLPVAIGFGCVVGLSLGLTGGGGAIFALPMLVYGLKVEPRQAVGISLAAVCLTSLAGFIARWRAGESDVATGFMFALAGMLGAPLGSWMSTRIPANLLLSLFAALVFFTAVLMWRRSVTAGLNAKHSSMANESRACDRNARGNLQLTSRCALLLGFSGLIAGVLSGLFGVGGGFIIVPALTLFSGMAIHRAVGTSLLVIALVSAVGFASHASFGGEMPWPMTAVFVAGGLLGMYGGIWASHFVSASALQKAFSVALILVALFMIIRTAFAY